MLPDAIARCESADNKVRPHGTRPRRAAASRWPRWTFFFYLGSAVPGERAWTLALQRIGAPAQPPSASGAGEGEGGDALSRSWKRGSMEAPLVKPGLTGQTRNFL